MKNVCVPNGLLLTCNPDYLSKYPSLFFPGKEDNGKDPRKIRIRVSFEILSHNIHILRRIYSFRPNRYHMGITDFFCCNFSNIAITFGCVGVNFTPRFSIPMIFPAIIQLHDMENVARLPCFFFLLHNSFIFINLARPQYHPVYSGACIFKNFWYSKIMAAIAAAPLPITLRTGPTAAARRATNNLFRPLIHAIQPVHQLLHPAHDHADDRHQQLPTGYKTTMAKAHGQIEIREYYQTEDQNINRKCRLSMLKLIEIRGTKIS